MVRHGGLQGDYMREGSLAKFVSNRFFTAKTPSAPSQNDVYSDVERGIGFRSIRLELSWRAWRLGGSNSNHHCRNSHQFSLVQGPCGGLPTTGLAKGGNRVMGFPAMHARWIPLTLCGFLLAACEAGDEKKPVMETASEKPTEPAGKVEISDAEWKKRLTAEQFHILREAGTERPNGAVYKEFKHQGAGTYHCAGCGALLFSSKEKFDSGCGWPSFYDPAKAENVKTRKDTSLGMTRIEVTCAKCDGHLGHVFEGEGFQTPTDKRYCINGGGLKFDPAAREESTP
jgi:peptide-methionine (R)-S-oxide reductase